MALAILQFQDNHGTKNRFEVDIGTNQYYTYAIGNEEWHRSQGLQVLSNPKFTSSLIGPLAESSLGRTILEVPHQQFDRQNRYIQIISYRNQQREGIAISEIIKIPLISSTSTGNDDLPVMSFSQATTMENQLDTVPFAYKEEQPVSSAMFLGGLLATVGSAVPAILGGLKAAVPAVLTGLKAVAAPILKGVAGNPQLIGSVVSDVIPTLTDIISETRQSSTATPDPSKLLSILPTILKNPEVAKKLSETNPQTAQLLGALVQQAAQNTPATNTTAQSLPANGQTSNSLAVVGNGKAIARNNTLLSLEQSLIPTATKSPLATAASVAPPPSQYVEGMSVPVSLATCLPSLMPLMDKVMTRKMQRILMDENISDRKRMAFITHALMDIMGGFRGVSRNYRSRDSYSYRTAGAFSLVENGNKAANALIEGLSIGLSAPDPTLDYDRVESVKLDFVEDNTLMMQGRPRLLYSQDETISFPLEIETPRPITKGILQIIVKDPNTLEVAIEQKYRLEHITSGALSVVPELSPEQLSDLEANEEYLICAVLVWQGKSSKTDRTKRLGTSMTQLITLVGEYCFDRVEGTGEVIPLNDVDRFRPYWHKIWEGEFSSDLRRTNLDCKYYYALEPGRTNHARMETVTQIESTEGTRQTGKLKTGLILSAYRLNELLGQISDYPMLDEEELTALLSSEFKQQFSHCARNSVEFQGRRGDAVGLWVYPEFKLQRVLLKQVEETNENGQVLAFAEQTVYFPMPAIVHFIGVQQT